MIHNYKRTFDAVSMPPEHQKRIRLELSSRFSEKQKEDNVVNIKSIRKPRKALVAAVVALSIMLLAGVAYAYTNGSQIIQFLTGEWHIEYGEDVDSEGNSNYYVTYSTSPLSHPAEVRDGRIYFVLDGSDTDITSYCSEETYYEYESVTDDGQRHVILVGGTPDDLGWAEYLWDENGWVVGQGFNGNKTEQRWRKLWEEANSIEAQIEARAEAQWKQPE